MDNRTMAEIRKEKFSKQGQLARELADLALLEIDEALADQTFRPPGVIGSVACRSALLTPDPPEAA